MCGWFDLRVGERLRERHLLGQRYMRYAGSDACAYSFAYTVADGFADGGTNGGTNDGADGGTDDHINCRPNSAAKC